MLHDIICVKTYWLTPILTNLWWHKTCEKDVVGIVIFELIGLHFTITLLQCHAGVHEETFNVNIKIAQTMENIWNLACQQRSYSQGIWNVIVGKSGLLKKCMGGHYH